MKELATLAFIGSSRSCAQPKVEKIVYEIEPLPWYYIDCLDIGDFIVYKVSTKVHPWGVKFILVNSKIQNCTFKKFYLCVKKEK